jgi:hypothetical protein
VYDDGSGPALFVAGFFFFAGGIQANSIAKWDGTTWAAVGSGLVRGSQVANVHALAVHDDGRGLALYAAGDFTSAGGVPVNRMARWDGTSWSALGSGMNNDVNAVTAYDDGSGPALYAGGVFSTAGGVAASRIAKWDGSSWSALGVVGTSVEALTAIDDGIGPPWLAVGGSFGISPAGDIYIAKWGCPLVFEQDKTRRR